MTYAMKRSLRFVVVVLGATQVMSGCVVAGGYSSNDGGSGFFFLLPLLMFEFVWKYIWFFAFGLPEWFSGQQPPTFAEDFFNIGFGVILMPLVIPWGFVWRHYVKAPGDRWR